MTVQGNKPSRGNLMRVLGNIFKVLQEILAELKKLNAAKAGSNDFEKDVKPRYNNLRKSN